MPITNGKGVSIPFVAKRFAKHAGGLCRNRCSMAIRTGIEGWGFLRLAKARKVQLKAWMKPVVRVAICAFPGLPGCAGGVYRL